MLHSKRVKATNYHDLASDAPSSSRFLLHSGCVHAAKPSPESYPIYDMCGLIRPSAPGYGARLTNATSWASDPPDTELSVGGNLCSDLNRGHISTMLINGGVSSLCQVF